VGRLISGHFKTRSLAKEALPQLDTDTAFAPQKR
jgi:hypothetical protein